MEAPPRSSAAGLQYAVRHRDEGFVVEPLGRAPIEASDEGDLLLAFEKDATVELQKLRSDLFFLHAGCVAGAGGAVLFVGPSGAGKSTLIWSLIRDGFAFMSDELAPVCLERMGVEPYPRALGLKNAPPQPDELPETALATGRSFHVRAQEIGAETCLEPQPIRAIFHLEPWDVNRAEPGLRPASAAEATARLLANALNPLCHPAQGLDAALAISRSAPSFELRAAALGATCERIREVLVEGVEDP